MFCIWGKGGGTGDCNGLSTQSTEDYNYFTTEITEDTENGNYFTTESAEDTENGNCHFLGELRFALKTLRGVPSLTRRFCRCRSPCSP